jgi:phospholipase D1/2
MEQKSGVSFHEAQVALSRLWAGNPQKHMRGKEETVILSRPHDQSTDINHVAQKQTVNRGIKLPSTVDEALSLIKRFEAGAGEGNRGISDNVGQHSQQCPTTLFDEAWDGTEQEELESYISELTYIHA